MPPADVAVAVLRRATAPWRRWVDGPDRRVRSGPNASGHRGAAGRRAIGRGAARAAPTGVEPGQRAGLGAVAGRSVADAPRRTHRARQAPDGVRGRDWSDAHELAAGRAAYLAAMLCPMGAYGSGSVDRRKGPSSVSRSSPDRLRCEGATGLGQVDLPDAGRAVEGQHVGGVRAQGVEVRRRGSRRRRG